MVERIALHKNLKMAELLEVHDDYSGEDTGIQKVWELP